MVHINADVVYDRDINHTLSVWTELIVSTGERVNTREACYWITRMQELQASMRGNQWHPRVQNPDQRLSTEPITIRHVYADNHTVSEFPPFRFAFGV
jgi:hypothetical protein